MDRVWLMKGGTDVAVADDQSPRTDVPSRVIFVGMGPGDPDLLTLGAVNAVSDADVIIADTSAMVETILSANVGARADALVTSFDDLGGRLYLTLEERADQVLQAAAGGRRVVRLVAGDPFVDGGVSGEARACVQAGVDFEVIPGVSLLTAIPTYAGVSLSDSGEGVQFVSVSDVQFADENAAFWQSPGTVVLNAHASDAGALTAAALAAGRLPTEPVMATFRGGSTSQSSVATTLGELGFAVGDNDHDVPMLVVLGGGAAAFDEELSWFESKPLFGWRVIVPRTKDMMSPMTARLRGYGARFEEVPTITVERPRTPQQLDKAIRGLVEGRFEWVAFTSQNAVKAVREKFEEYGLDARAFSGLKVAAAGQVTAQALRLWGIEPDLVPANDQSTAGLAAEFPEFDPVLDPINRVFLPRADIATETLFNALTRLGWEVEDVTAYRTVRAAPPPAHIREAIKGGQYDAVLFTSSSTVRNFVGIAGKPHASTIVAVIGPATAKTCEEHGLRVDVMAVSPSAIDLADALAAYATERRKDLTKAGQPVTRPSQRRGRRRTF